jgi:ABC-2 type transport system ATP-binding protein
LYPGSNKPAVENLSLDVDNGEIVGFAGLNGAGKTTTIRACSGIILPTSGNIRIDGNDIVAEKKKASVSIGWVPEFPNFELNARPVPLLKYYGRFYGMNKVDLESRIEILLKAVGLTEHTQKRLKNYSQGMKKRFSFASALLSDPGNLLLDETLNGLDPEGIRYVKELVISMKNEGKSILLSSHILSELENVADRIAIISAGKIVALVDHSDLTHLGNSISIRISVSNIDKMISSFLDRYGNATISGSDIIITNVNVGEKEAGKLNNELARAGYLVYRFSVEGEKFEDYFLNLVGD